MFINTGIDNYIMVQLHSGVLWNHKMAKLDLELSVRIALKI